MERREFFSTLIAGGATVRKTRKHVKHSGDTPIYHGPMTIPAHVAEAVREDPTPMRATGRGTHLVMRYAEADGTVYVFRCRVPDHRKMVGEIVRTAEEHRIRVCCWSAADPDRYTRDDEPLTIIAAKAAKIPSPEPATDDSGRGEFGELSPQLSALILPPLVSPKRPDWATEMSIDE